MGYENKGKGGYLLDKQNGLKPQDTGLYGLSWAPSRFPQNPATNTP